MSRFHKRDGGNLVKIPTRVVRCSRDETLRAKNVSAQSGCGKFVPQRKIPRSKERGIGAPDTFKSEPNADFSRSAKVMVSVPSLKLKLITILSSNKNTEFTKLFIKLLPYMQNRITYLSSLIPYLSGVKYLKHKQRIERRINSWEKEIRQEEIRELLEDWY